MKQILTVDSIVSSSSYICKDSTGKKFQVDSITKLSKGQSILLKNGIVVGVVQTDSPEVYEV